MPDYDAMKGESGSNSPEVKETARREKTDR